MRSIHHDAFLEKDSNRQAIDEKDKSFPWEGAAGASHFCRARFEPAYAGCYGRCK
jgi:hypothetical protein